MSWKVLVTCPPMLRQIGSLAAEFEKHGFGITAPEVRQTLAIEELIGLVGDHDGWIIGDDPATRAVFEAGKKGRLKAAVKWGIGVDNVDFEAARDFGISIVNTPGVFGAEVADLAIGYLIGLARETYLIDREVRKGNWPKPAGISLKGKRLGLVGFGDIGQNIARRAAAAEMLIQCYDPAIVNPAAVIPYELASWPDGIAACDFIVFACALTPSSRHMFNTAIVNRLKAGVRIINVSRGPVIDERALIAGLRGGVIHSAALDVFEEEPLPPDSPLRAFERCVFGSHNASNTQEAVMRVSHMAIEKLAGFLSAWTAAP